MFFGEHLDLFGLPPGATSVRKIFALILLSAPVFQQRSKCLSRGTGGGALSHEKWRLSY